MLDGLRGGDRDEQRARVGVADVLGGEHDHAPGDEAGILAALEHRREVVDGRVGVGAAHRLDERRDEVVVRVAALVVDERPLAGGVLDVLVGDRARPRRRPSARPARGCSSAWRASPPARRTIRSRDLLGDLDAELRARRGRTTTARSSSECGSSSYSCMRDSSAELTSKYGFSVVAPISVTTPVLDRRQQRVLLRLVEAVDLVEEEDRPLPVRAEPLARAREHPAHVGDRGRHRRELLERGARRCARRCARASSCRCPAARSRIIEPTRSSSMPVRSAERSPRIWRWPTNSSRVCGRTLIASGATSGSRRLAASEKRSPTTPKYAGAPWLRTCPTRSGRRRSSSSAS